jgi:hypothetical protein
MEGTSPKDIAQGHKLHQPTELPAARERRLSHRQEMEMTVSMPKLIFKEFARSMFARGQLLSLCH